MNYKTELVEGFWRYVEGKGMLAALDRSKEGTRPPVFTKADADRNVIRSPVESPERLTRLLETIPCRSRHRWFRSMTSSQALAQSVFGNLIVHDQLGILAKVKTESGEPLIGSFPVSAKLEYGVKYLGEPRQTDVDVLIRTASGYRVAIECKLTEPEVGTCSRPRLPLNDRKYEKEHCDGTYTCQHGRNVRCSLSGLGIAYWRHIPSLFQWASDCDHKPCPVRETYQLVRNVLAISVDESGKLDAGKGHAVLVYDERNPAFVEDGVGYKAYTQTHEALREKSTLRRCSWQTILKQLRLVEELKWLTDELKLKYGL